MNEFLQSIMTSVNFGLMVVDENHFLPNCAVRDGLAPKFMHHTVREVESLT
ncbi:MAG TPA: hypothetical protein VEI04_08045 [Syntrophobacteria bacterium]|nr:hypothetical protein [archaeon]HYA03053.1 hypothetical protein [Syntrophobacteria bacterium]